MKTPKLLPAVNFADKAEEIREIYFKLDEFDGLLQAVNMELYMLSENLDELNRHPEKDRNHKIKIAFLRTAEKHLAQLAKDFERALNNQEISDYLI